MERHQCKLCSKSFHNGRALGGHMRTHLVPLPVPPKPLQLSDDTESNSSIYSSSEEEEDEEEEKVLIYGLRENPKKSFKLVDPEFLDAGSVVQENQDRESESESTRNPTRKRSKRTPRMPKLKKPSSAESMAEFEAVSSASETSPADEDVALCLMMLSRDIWSSPPSQTRERYQCEICNKVFKSSQALGGHRTSHKKVKKCLEHEGYTLEQKPRKKKVGKKNVDEKVHECPICSKVFGSGQALGGHKRSHFLGSSSTTATASSSSTTPKQPQLGESLVIKKEDSGKFGGGGGGGLGLIDLNLPAPMEDEEDSAVSNAEFFNPIKH